MSADIEKQEVLAVVREDNSDDGMMFYRCVLCHRIVSQWDIKEHRGCASCGNRKVSPTNLTALEKLVQIFKHPAVWRWHEPVQPKS